MTTKNLTMNLLKSGMLVLTAGLMMGNQSCEQAQVSQRELKRIVEMGKITSPKVNLPQGGSFDFEYVANQQVYGVLQTSDHFALRYATPVGDVPGMPTNGDQCRRRRQASVFNRRRVHDQSSECAHCGLGECI
jgi:hypothetical protein